MDITNFQQFIEDSDNKDAEYHGWKLITDDTTTTIQLRQVVEANKSLVPLIQEEASMV